jgi:hypothetical protein
MDAILHQLTTWFPAGLNPLWLLSLFLVPLAFLAARGDVRIERRS